MTVNAFPGRTTCCLHSMLPLARRRSLACGGTGVDQ